MYQVEFIISGKDEEEFTEKLFACGAGSVSVHRLQAGKLRIVALLEDAEAARSRFPQEYRTFSWLSECEWKYRWLDGYRGVKISKDIQIRSALDPRENDEPCRYVIRLDPRDAFGDGNHPTTRLCLLALHRILLTYPPDVRGGLRLLDAGTGTGVLSILAGLMGVGHVDAVEIDREAGERARGNFSINGCGHIRLHRSDIKKFKPKCTYDIVTANLLTGILLETAGRIRDLAGPSGLIILSGVSDRWDREMRQFLREEGFILRKCSRRNGWNCYILQNPLRQ